MSIELIILLALVSMGGVVLATLRVVHLDAPSRSHQPLRSHELDEFARTGSSWR